MPIKKETFLHISKKPTFYIDTRTLPVFSTPPSILFVDLNLAPGETKKCKAIWKKKEAKALMDIN